MIENVYGNDFEVAVRRKVPVPAYDLPQQTMFAKQNEAGLLLDFLIVISIHCLFRAKGPRRFSCQVLNDSS